MRRWIAVAAGLAVLAVANYAIYAREQLVTHGRVVLLELAPVDPRSLMQGDYMALRFKVAGDAFARRPDDGSGGYLVIGLDARGVGGFVRVDDGKQLGQDELRMRYRVRNGMVKFGTNAYFFQEGRAERFETARYGEYRVGEDGEAILTQLRGRDLELLR